MHCMYENAKENIIERIKGLQFVSLTTDTWTSKSNDGFIAVSAHGITENWELHESIIAVENIKVKLHFLVSES